MDALLENEMEASLKRLRETVGVYDPERLAVCEMITRSVYERIDALDITVVNKISKPFIFEVEDI